MTQECEACGAAVRYVRQTTDRIEIIDSDDTENLKLPQPETTCILLRVCIRCAVIVFGMDVAE